MKTIITRIASAGVPTAAGWSYTRETLERIALSAPALGSPGYDGLTSLPLDRVSHEVLGMWMAGDALVAEIRMLDTPAGKILQNAGDDIRFHPVGTGRVVDGEAQDYELLAITATSERSRKMAGISTREYIDFILGSVRVQFHTVRCHACEGEGDIYDNQDPGKRRDCVLCKGTGRVNVADYHMLQVASCKLWVWGSHSGRPVLYSNLYGWTPITFVGNPATYEKEYATWMSKTIDQLGNFIKLHHVSDAEMIALRTFLYRHFYRGTNT